MIKDYPCKTRRELQKEEGKLIRENRQDITNYFIGDVSSHDFWKAYGIIRKMGEL